MKGIFYIFLGLFSVVTSAQNLQRSSLGTGGSNSQIELGGTTFYVLSSIGQQSVIGLASNDTYTLRQGYQQPPIRVAELPNTVNDLFAIVFPNPTDNFVTVLFGSPITSDILSTLYDIQGRVIESRIIAPTQSFEIDLASLATGNYMLQIRIKGDSFTTRLIKN